jgi:hypothetical protein
MVPKKHDAIPRSWLTCVVSQETALGHAILCAASYKHREEIRQSFATYWNNFRVVNSVQPNESVYWFESTSKTHAGLAIVRDGLVSAYQVFDTGRGS